MTQRMLLALGLVLATCATGAEQRWARQLWDGVAGFPSAKVTGALAASVRQTGRAGDRAMPAVFLHPTGTGRAVAAFPEAAFTAAPGERLFFVGHAGLADGVKWDDEANPPDGVRFHVELNGRALAQVHLDKSRWAPLVAALPGPAAGAATAALSLATDCGEGGNSSYDWAMFGRPGVIAVDARPLPAGTAVSGAGGTVVVQLGAGPATIVIEGLDTRGQGLDEANASADATGGLAFMSFDFGACEECVAWRWRVEKGQATSAWGGSWQPQVTLDHVGPARAVTLAGERLRVRAGVRNLGRGALLPSRGAWAECNGQRQPLPRIAPGEVGHAEFDLGAASAGAVSLRASAVCLGRRTEATAEVDVWPPIPDIPAKRPVRGAARAVAPGFLLVENATSRWLVHTGAKGLAALVYVWADGRWELAGSVAPWVEYDDERSTSLRPAFATVKPVTSANGAGFEAEGVDGALAVRVTARLPHDGRALAVEVTATARERVGLRRLAGPALRAGDRAAGADKGLAVFPGLDFLDGDERSSSQRDLQPPLHERWVPHKFKVTVPMMIVETRRAGPVLGLVWDPRQRWHGEQIAPAARFASPDFLEQQDNHLMQLMLPSAPDGMAESAARADEAVVLEPGDSWRLRHYLLAAQPKPDATVAFEWYDSLVGYPKAEPAPRSFEDEIALCRHGFMVTCWDPETKKNRHCVGWSPVNAPGHAALLFMDARTVAQGQDRERVLERVKLIAERTLAQSGPGGLASSAGCHIMRWEFPYHYGHLPGALPAMERTATGAMDRQEADGGWGYHPDERRSVLGEPDTRVIGICAREAFSLALWTAVSGSEDGAAALRRALEHMERYRVPRGAQGWECPILEPDVLAAAYAVRAYVWAYMALGEERWLDKAEYWARTGLPFQYVWDDGQHPGMRYASIPVFGSTFFRHSWIGLPVQWCGLVYAYGLQELMRFRPNDLWRRQVAGMTVSAMHQQWPWDGKKELVGTYPDSFGNWFTRRNPVHINPEDIAVNLLALHGRDPGLRVRRVPAPGGVVHVAAPCDFTAEGRAGVLRIALRYVADEVVYLTVGPVAGSAVGRVQANGVALEREKDLGAGEVGWAYAPRLGIVVVGVRCDGQGRGQVDLSGLRRQRPQALAARVGWEFVDGAEGWQAMHSCSMAARDGGLAIKVTGPDPYAASGPARIPSQRFKHLRVRARMTSGERLGLFWRTSRSQGWSADKHTDVALTGDGEWREVVFDLGRHQLWRGTVLQVRLDPEPADVPAGTVLELDWVRPE